MLIFIIELEAPGRAEDHDETQDQIYTEDLEKRIQRIVEAHLAARGTASEGGGPMILPWSCSGLMSTMKSLLRSV